jgi:hypothetical protein
MFWASFCPSSGAQDWDVFTTYGITSCWCGMQVFRACCLALRVQYTVKTSQSCAPEEGQKLARNMLGWSWRSIKLLLLHLVGVPYLPTYIDDARSNTNQESICCFVTVDFGLQCVNIKFSDVVYRSAKNTFGKYEYSWDTCFSRA